MKFFLNNKKMSSNIDDNEKEKLIYRSILISIRDENQESNNNVINLKMRKINKKHKTQTLSEKLRTELKKLLGDLHNTKFTKDKIKTDRIKKLTPFQKILKENAIAKRAISIKKNMVLNPLNLEYAIKFRNNKNQKLNIKNNNIFKIINRTEKSFHSPNKSFFDLNKTPNKFIPEKHINFSVKNVKLPLSRNYNLNLNKEEKNNNNFDIFNTNEYNNKKNKIELNNRKEINNLMPYNHNLLNRYSQPQIPRGNMDRQNYSKTYSKMNLKIPIIKRKENLSQLNKYIRTECNERYKERFKPMNIITEPKIYSYIKKNENSKKVIINKKNINKTYYSFLLNKSKYNNGFMKKKCNIIN